MSNIILPNPNTPYYKSDGSLNANGRLKIFLAGTTTPVEVYKTSGGVSYGHTVDLNSSGLPEDGTIFWDADTLYKVEVYTRSDETFIHSLDYTTDSYGMGVEDTTDAIEENTTWQVKPAGGGGGIFSSLSDAMDAARLYTIADGTSLTIEVFPGTYQETGISLDHPNGENIMIQGHGYFAPILSFDIATPAFHLSPQKKFKHLNNLTIDYTSVTGQVNNAALWVGGTIENVSLKLLSSEDPAPSSYNTAVLCMGGSILGGDLLATNFSVGLEVRDGGRAVMSVNTQSDPNHTCDKGIICSGFGSYVKASLALIHSGSNTTGEAGVHCEDWGVVHLGDTVNIANMTVGLRADTEGAIDYTDTSPSFTNCTTNINKTVNSIVTTAGSVDFTRVTYT